jgi:hypothetical protein
MAHALRTREACYEVVQNTFGCYLRRIPDPDANAELTPDIINSFQIKPDFNKIPATVWAPWVQLCFHFAQNTSSLEVAAAILIKDDDPTQWRLTVPKQSVSGGSVQADLPIGSIDVATGEVIDQWPPAGWLPVGTTHSHGTMGAFFSATDDEDEIRNPGLHMVVGNIDHEKMTYEIASSITANGKRFKIDYNLVIDHTPVEELTFHQGVLANISTERLVSSHHRTGRWTDFDGDEWKPHWFWGDKDDIEPSKPQRKKRKGPGDEWLPKDIDEMTEQTELGYYIIEYVDERIQEAIDTLAQSKDAIADSKIKHNDTRVLKLRQSLSLLQTHYLDLICQTAP